MPGWGWAAVAVALGLLGAGILIWRPLRSALRESHFTRAKQGFHRQREWLEARFFSAASVSGKPRGLLWSECDFEDDVTYARNRKSGELSAFVGVTIAFKAIEGGSMEGVEAVGNLRAATAVFQFIDGAWKTEGRAIFNLNPTEAIAYYRDDLEMVGEERV